MITKYSKLRSDSFRKMHENHCEHPDRPEHPVRSRIHDGGRLSTRFICKCIHMLMIYCVLINLCHYTNSLPTIFDDFLNEDYYNYDYDDNDGGKNDTNISICTTKQCWSYREELRKSIDPKVDPCEDFFQFTCGRWIIEHPIPAHRHSWNQFDVFAMLIKNDLNKVLNAKEEPIRGDFISRLRTFYNGCINLDQRNRTGYRELFEISKQLGGWPMLMGTHAWEEQFASTYQWENAYTILSHLGVNYLINIGPMIDFRNTSKITIKFGPPYQTSENIINFMKMNGINTKPMNKDIDANVNDGDGDGTSEGEKLYLKLFQELYEYYPEPENGSNEFNLNQTIKDIAEIYHFQQEMEDQAGPIYSMSYYQMYYERHLVNVSTIKNLVKFNISFILEEMFNRKFPDDELLFVPDMEYVKNLDKLLAKTPKKVLANYFSANTVYEFGRHTTPRMIELLISKMDTPDVIQNICFAETLFYLPEFVGKTYLVHFFDLNTFNNLKTLADSIRNAFRQLLNESQWMDRDTIEKAVEKLDNMHWNIAFPEWFDKVIKLELSLETGINSSNYLLSVTHVLQIREEITREMLDGNFLAKLNATHANNWPGRQILENSDPGTDVPAEELRRTSCYGDIPTGILQDLIYSAHLPSSIAFGSIGFILAHEMTHAFDQFGRLYDWSGALTNWWTRNTSESFVEKASCFARQYSNYSINTAQVNGNQTLAENIADNAGIREAFRAFKNYRKTHKKELRLPGEMSAYSPDQLFFISFGHLLCANLDQYAINSIVEYNEHSPPSIRVKGSLANFPEFAETFKCSPDSPMNPEAKCVLY